MVISLGFHDSLELWKGSLKQPLSFSVDHGEQLGEEAVHTPPFSRKANKKSQSEQTALKGLRKHVHS